MVDTYIQTATNTFDDAGDLVSITVARRGASVNIVMTDADQQVVHLQRELGAPGSGAWFTELTFDNGPAAVDTYYITKQDNERLRLIVQTDGGGAGTGTLRELNRIAKELKLDDGTSILQIWESREVVIVAGAEFNVAGGLAVASGGNKAPAETANFTAGAAHVNKITPITVGASTITIVLPSSTGSGDKYAFLITANATPSSVIVSCDADAGAFVGDVGVYTDAAGLRFASDGVNDLFTMNGTTTGGLPGTYVEFIDAAVDFWAVRGALRASGAEATPFSGT